MKTGQLILFGFIALALTACGVQRSSRPMLSVAPSVAANNDVYLADQSGRIRAFRTDGSEQWNLSLPNEILKRDNTVSHDLRIDTLTARSPTVGAERTIYITGPHYNLHAVARMESNVG